MLSFCGMENLVKYNYMQIVKINLLYVMQWLIFNEKLYKANRSVST